MKIYTRGFPDGWGYYRSAGSWIPGRIAPSLPSGFAPLRVQRGDPLEVYSRDEALQAVKECIEQQERIDAEVARMDAAFAKLDAIEASYRKHFGPIRPVTER